MIVQQSPASAPPREDLLAPGMAAALDRLDLMTRRLFAGKMPGERRAKARGQSVEFDDHREYVPGDDLRHIDWNVFARMDRFVLKVFREDKDLTLSIVVDASPSMLAAGPGTGSRSGGGAGDGKLLAAARLAAALAYIGLVNNNRVALSAFGDERGLRRLAPVRGRVGIERAIGFLRDAVADAAAAGPRRGLDPRAGLHDAVARLAALRSQRGVLVLLTDALVPDVGGALAPLAAAGPGFDAWLLQVLAPSELDPALERDRGLNGDVALTDVETGRSVELSVSPALLARYRERFAQHQRGVAEACRRHGLRHTLVTTDRPVADVILDELRRGGLLR